VLKISILVLQALSLSSTLQDRDEAALVRGVLAADEGSVMQAYALVEKAPGLAERTILDALPKVKEGWIRAGLVRQLGGIEGYRASTEIADLMTGAPDLATRVHAARLVALHDVSRSALAMAREWVELPPEYVSGEEELAQFLFSTGRAFAVQVLGRNLGAQPVKRRAAVAFKSADSNSHYFRPPLDPVTKQALPSGAFWLAVEEVLVGRLSDKSVAAGSISYNHEWFVDPTVAERALLSLRRLWPDKYSFAPGGARIIGEQKRIGALNIWRRERGKPEFPLPTISLFTLPQERVDQLVREVVSADDPSTSGEALKRLESFGLAASPPLLRALRDLPPTTERVQLWELSCRIANRVRTVTFDTNSELLPKKLMIALNELYGEQLSVARFRKVWNTALSEWPQNLKSFSVELDREVDGTGFAVLVRSTHSDSPGYKNWAYLEKFDAGPDLTRYRKGTVLPRPDLAKLPLEALQEALKLGPKRAISVSYTIYWD
jgi:hypothetical protein